MALTNVGQKPVRIVQAGDGPGTLVNRDLTNILYYGKDVSIAGDNPNSVSILDPLVGIPIDGKDDIWAITPVGVTSITVDYMPLADSWNPSPAQAAQQIALLGLATAVNQGTQIGHESNIDNQTASTVTNLNNVVGVNSFLSATNPGALVSAAGIAVAQDFLAAHTGVTRENAQQMKNAAQAVTTEIAALIATGLANGTPGGTYVLHGFNTIDSNTAGITVNQGTPVTQPTKSVIGQGAIMALQLSTPSNSIVALQIDVNWVDTTTGLFISTRRIAPLAGNSADHIIMVRMPVEKEEVSVTFTCQGAGGTSVSIDKYLFVSCSQFIDKFIARTRGSLPNFTALGVPAPGNTANAKILIFYQNANLVAGSSVTFVLPLYSGRVKIYGQIGANGIGGNGLNVSIATTVGALTGQIYEALSQANGYLSDYADLPGYQCTITILNNSAANRAVDVAILGDDDD